MRSWRTVVDRLYRSQRCLVLRAPLAGPPAANRDGDVVFSVATVTDMARLGDLEPYGRGATGRTYVEKDGDILFVARHDDRLVATRRYSRVVRDAVVARIVRLEADQIWAADIFCLPQYRNGGIARKLGMYAERVLASRGYTELLGTVSVTNTPSLRSILGKGSRPVLYVSYRRLLGVERLRVSREIPRRVLDDISKRPV